MPDLDESLDDSIQLLMRLEPNFDLVEKAYRTEALITLVKKTTSLQTRQVCLRIIWKLLSEDTKGFVMEFFTLDLMNLYSQILNESEDQMELVSCLTLDWDFMDHS